ncbi:MAG: immunity 53 family protein [Planctomycetes bacterium]|nr:immunity 53 family protein [Planctomycetota bacterium]
MIDWLQNWYCSNCDGGWEHSYGIKIQTLDNPGWHVEIDLMETRVADKPFAEVAKDESDADWIICRVQNGKFDGAGDPSKLSAIITIFKNWVQSPSLPHPQPSADDCE